MKVLYFDPICGASGDMILASLVDLGVKIAFLKKNLAFITDFEINVKDVNRDGIIAKNLQFVIKKEIREDKFLKLIEKSQLSENIKDTASRIIKNIFEAEKKVHHTRDVHLHELGDADTLLDVVGAVVAIDSLNVTKIYTAPLKTGMGFIKTREGNMPAFNFATAELLKGFPVEFLPVPYELTTPTAAAILSSIAEPVKSLSFKRIDNIGLGAGMMEIKDYPNLLRVFLGEVDETISDECQIIEANIDDQNPQDYEIVFEKLYKAGALEVFLTPVIMKNSRPGVILTVLATSNNHKVLDIIFQETTTLGVRITNAQRIKLHRNVVNLSTPYGKLRVKTFLYNNIKRFSIEYQDLKKIALKFNKPLKDLRQELTGYVEKILKEKLLKGRSLV
uniref:Nickel pincer cofactor biosynthesis protein LarC n=1 Tax=candidate division WOR-3 bacterium TaxID=2052148 RepID=A0A7C4TI97_UNCW3